MSAARLLAPSTKRSCKMCFLRAVYIAGTIIYQAMTSSFPVPPSGPPGIYSDEKAYKQFQGDK